MTDLIGIAAIIAAVAAAGTQLAQSRRLTRRDTLAAAERAADRKEAKADREEVKAERARAAAKLDDIGKKVDGTQTALVEKIDALRSDKAHLKTALIARDAPGASSVNESAGPVSIDDAKVVHIESEERRK